MKAIYTLLILLIPFVGLGQYFENIYGDNWDDWGNSVIQANDGGFVVIGAIDPGIGQPNLFVLKTDLNGVQQWFYEYGDNNQRLNGYSIEKTNDGGYVLVGEIENIGSYIKTIVIKLNENGEEQWSETYSYEGEIFGNFIGLSIKNTNDYGYVITGISSTGVFILKIDENGVESWRQETSQLQQTYAEVCDCILQTSDNGFLITGHNSDGIFILKTNQNGTEQWRRIYDEISAKQVYSIKKTEDGGYVLTGYSKNNELNAEVFLLKTDFNGNIEWYNSFTFIGQPTGLDKGYTVEETSDNGFIITGHAGISNTRVRVGLLKTDENGNKLWHKLFGESNFDYGASVLQTNDDGYIITGSFFYQGYVFLIKTNENGELTSTIEIPIQNKNKKLERTINLEGQEINFKINQPVIEIYNDGSVEKKVIIE